MIVQALGRRIVLMGFMAVMLLQAAAPAMAQPAGASNPGVDPSVCTSMSDRIDELQNANPPGPGEPKGILTEISGFIKDVTESAAQSIFSAFINNPDYKFAVGAVLTLYVAIFGAMFTMGIVQATFGQVLMRLLKFALITALLVEGWAFFSDIVVRFFNDGTDELICAVMSIAAGEPANSTNCMLPSGEIAPFYRLDRVASFLIHPDTIVAIMGSATSGVYSFGMTGLMLLSFLGFVKLLVDALQTYAVAFVVRTMLLGLAPLFFIFLLFERTKNLFTGWINLLVSFSLNPILLFTFLSFMVVMIQSATYNMMNVELCWSSVQVDGAPEGTTKQKQFWRFMDTSKSPPEPYLLDWTFEGNEDCRAANGGSNAQCPQFPIKIIDVLTFFLLVWLAMRFAEVIDRISNELSSAVASLSADTKLMHYLSKDEGGASMPNPNPSAIGGAPPQGNRPTGPKE